MSDLPKRAPRLRPELDDLGAFEPVDLPEALTRWMAWARAATRDQAMTADDVTSPSCGCTRCCRCCGPARRGR
jgi:ATP-dependent RNA helicase SUPV3L1/SUV3